MDCYCTLCPTLWREAIFSSLWWFFAVFRKSPEVRLDQFATTYSSCCRSWLQWWRDRERERGRRRRDVHIGTSSGHYPAGPCSDDDHHGYFTGWDVAGPPAQEEVSWIQWKDMLYTSLCTVQSLNLLEQPFLLCLRLCLCIKMAYVHKMHTHK